MALIRPAVVMALVAAGMAVPAVLKSPYSLQIATLVVTFAVLMVSLNICFGYAGLVSVAHGGLFGLGAYAIGVLTITLGWSFWPALMVGVGLGATVGLVLGVLTLRMGGHYFAIGSLAFGVMIQFVMKKLTSVTGGELGLSPVPPVTPITLPGGHRIEFTSLPARYGIAYAFLVMAVGVMVLLRRSRAGRGLAAIRQNPRLAEAVGISVVRMRLIALATSGAIAGAAGALYATFVTFIEPSVASTNLNIQAGIALIIGGVGTTLGPVVAAITLVGLPEFLRDSQDLAPVLLGTVLLVIIRFAPRGIVGELGRLASHLRLRRGVALRTPRTPHAHAGAR